MFYSMVASAAIGQMAIAIEQAKADHERIRMAVAHLPEAQQEAAALHLELEMRRARAAENQASTAARESVATSSRGLTSTEAGALGFIVGLACG